MPGIKTILAPTDFSASSQAALRYACDFADRFGATLHLLHVVHVPPVPSAMEMYPPMPEDVADQLERHARTDLEAQLSPEQRKKYSTELVIRRGSPAEEILEYLKQHEEIGLVILSTSGRGGVARLMMGSVADKIVRSAPCPVLTVHPHAHAETDTRHRAA